jgi:hypothetical protein
MAKKERKVNIELPRIRKKSGFNLRYYSETCLLGLRKSKKNPDRIVDIPAEIPNGTSKIKVRSFTT